MKDKEKIDRMLEVYDKLKEATESFKPFSTELCYLFPAILKETEIELDLGIESQASLYETLKQVLGLHHFVWEYIMIID